MANNRMVLVCNVCAPTQIADKKILSQYKQQLVEEIEKMERHCVHCDGDPEEFISSQCHIEYNEALQDVKKTITKENL